MDFITGIVASGIARGRVPTMATGLPKMAAIAGFHTVGAWVQVRVLWDQEHKTHIFRKSTLNFTKSLSFVLIGLILNKIQPFKKFKICKEMHGFPSVGLAKSI